MSVDPDALRKVRFLAPLNDRNIKRLAGSMTERAAAAGDDLVEQGTGGVAFFAILDGEATVMIDGREVRKLGPGDHFGELALIVPDVQRTASVRADTEMHLAAMSSWNFKGFVSEHPEVTWPLLVTLAEQLASS
ncbi:MAG TPA: cyclic nucleotide-binding domain-containing protein [Solirubrobacteraceae bacterium]|nr:cyclic nucleotide-binding domain-containing protein [Solirubrobacteraceae bacterium]